MGWGPGLSSPGLLLAIETYFETFEGLRESYGALERTCEDLQIAVSRIEEDV
jgi:hypothetical protein